MGDRRVGLEFIERVPVAAGLVDAAGTVIAINPGLARMVGRAEGTPVGEDAMAFVHPDDLARLADHFFGILDGRFPDGVAIDAKISDGHGGWVDAVCAGLNLVDEPGFESILTLIRPSSESTTRGWFEAVVSGTDDIIQVVDEHGRFLWASGPIEPLIGVGAEAMVGRTILDFAEPEMRSTAWSWFEKLKETPGPHPNIVGDRPGFDGTMQALEVRANNLLHDPEVRGVVLRTRDVSAQRRADALQRFSHQVVHGAPVAIFTADVDGMVTTWNPACEGMLGFEAHEVLGRRFRDLGAHTDESFSSIISNVEAVLRGERVEIETRFLDKRGNTVPLYIVMSSIRGSLGRVEGFLAFGIDLRPQLDASVLADTEARWAAMSRATHELVALLEADGTVLWAGSGFANLLGHDPATMVGRNARDWAHPDDRGRPGGLDRLGRDGIGAFTREYRLQHANGSWRIFDVTVTDLRDEPTVKALLISGRDVTDRVAAEEARHEREAQSLALAALGQRALAGASVADVLGDACELVARTLSVPHAHVVLRSADRRFHEVSAAVGLFAPDVGRRDPVERRTWAQLLDHSTGPLVEEDFERPGATERPLAYEGSAVRSGVLCAIDGREGPIGFLGALDEQPRAFPEADLGFVQSLANVLATAIERSRVSDEMRRRALHDDLTGLPNRTLLLDRLAQALSRLGRRGGTVGLLFVDLDRFKRVNDTMGHGAGDEVLVTAARRLLASVRAGDTVARTGGDEFLILTEELVEAGDAMQLAERVAGALAAPVHIDGHVVHVSASIGVAITTEEVDADELVRDADLAMYRAKEDGRARVKLFDGTMRDEAMSRMTLELALRAAVADRDIRVVFQPQVNLLDRSPVGVEALARWDHPRLGAVPPASFVALAEEIDILDDITHLVLDATCRTLVAARALAPHLTASVNLSPRQIGRERVVDLVERVVSAYGLPNAAVLIELTETTALDGNAAIATLGALHDRGFGLAIDDFGTGYSSMTRLANLPVDAVKIDQSFVSDVDSDQGSAAVVSATMSLAGMLDLEVVAEGVETEAQRLRLIELGCRAGQGWLFSGPLDHEGVLAWLQPGPSGD